MTAQLTRVDAAVASSPRMFAATVGITMLVALSSAVLDPSAVASHVIVVAVIVLLGIPHGAVDHLVESSRSATTGEPNFAWHVRFHVVYLAAMFAYGSVWLVAPALAVIGFLVMSVHHFGQSDLAHLRLDTRRQLAVQTSRGLLLVGLPLVAHLSDVAPVIERLGGFDPTTWTWLDGRTGTWCVALVAQHLVVGVVVAPSLPPGPTRRRELITVLVVTALLVVSDPLIGFAVYFGLWHSAHHLRVLADVLGRRVGPGAMTPTELVRVVAPRSVVSIVALAGVVLLADAVDRPEWIVPITLVFVSMLTVPHMFVVERLWRAERSDRMA